MQKHLNKSTVKSAASEHIVQGTMLGLMAAIGYTAANVFLRSSIAVDPYWVSCVKSIPTVVLFGPWLLVRVARSQPLLPPLRPFATLVAAAVLGQVGGNVVFQWALGVIGIALTVPICLGAMIITGAVTGSLFLREKITWRTLGSIVMLIAAVSVLSLGAPTAQASLAEVVSHDARLVTLGVLAACISGISYALLGVAIRNAAQQGCPAVTTLVTVGVAGVMVLFPLSVHRIGLAEMLATDSRALMWMTMAGLANAAAFIALTKSLEFIGVIYLNALNATQAAMAAIAGVLVFGEPLSTELASGVALTAIGLTLMRRGREKRLD